jgi:hypothetical protein
MYERLSKIVLLSGLIMPMKSMGAELVPMATEINNSVKNSVSEKMQKGLISDSVSSVPIFDNVVKQGIRMPEDTINSIGSELVETPKANEVKKLQK